MLFRNDPGFERKPGGEGLEDDEFLGILDDPLPKTEFLLDQIAIDTTSVVIVIPGGFLQFFPDIGRNDCGTDELGMGMVQ
jgi:hypothetical protein